MPRCAFLLATLSLLVGACDRSQSESKHAATAEPTTPTASSVASARAPTVAQPSAVPAGSGSGRIRTVFLILMENKVWSEVKGSPDAPFINGTLVPRASIATGYRAPRDGNLHPSEPNYIWLEAGDNLGITDDAEPSANHRAVPDHLVTLLEKANVSWKTYQEDIAGDVCPLTRTREYTPKHNPMVFFDDVTGGNDPHSARCIAHMRPLGELANDLRNGKTARYNFITPNNCNDMHSSCEPLRNPIRQGDDFLAAVVPKILESAAYRDDGVLFITWDEAEMTPDCVLGDCPVGLLAFSPLAKGGGFISTHVYDHSSLLRTLQEIFGVQPFLGGAATAGDLGELFTAFP
jgi:hypothetical protein